MSSQDPGAWRLQPAGEAKWRSGAWRFIPPPLLASSRKGPTEDNGLDAEAAVTDWQLSEASEAVAAASAYRAGEALTEAANTAIMLGQPLLLTGEPGSGKSEFAEHVAWQLGVPKVLRFQMRSDMAARELFYRYDDLQRFREAQRRVDQDQSSAGRFNPENFLYLSAMGEAIVRASHPATYAALRERLIPGIAAAATRSVVLIDEIDKAPRDVPNDLLGFVTPDRMWFDLPELSGRATALTIEAAHQRQPIIICTSNSERSLPDAFLRRCLFHEIAFPEGDELRRIVAARARGCPETCDLVAAVEKEVKRVRDGCPAGSKKPGLAETLSFTLALQANGFQAGDSAPDPKRNRDRYRLWLSLSRMTLWKQREDYGLFRSADDGNAGRRQ